MDEGNDRNPSIRLVQSALYLDLDNFALALERNAPAALDAFRDDPSRLIRWLTEQALPPVGPARRRLVIRRAYFNPYVMRGWQARLVSAGFEAVDCPTLSGHGLSPDRRKNAADIRIAVDAMDDLGRLDGLDEVIVFSADSDFTPLLTKLRSRGQWATIVATGNVATAYRAVADLVIERDRIVAEALGVTGHRSGSPSQPELAAAHGQETPSPVTATLSAAEVADHVVEIVAGTDGLAAAAVAEALAVRWGSSLHSPGRWLGKGTLFSLLRSIDNPHIDLIARPGHAEIAPRLHGAVVRDAGTPPPGLASEFAADLAARLDRIAA